MICMSLQRLYGVHVCGRWTGAWAHPCQRSRVTKLLGTWHFVCKYIPVHKLHTKIDNKYICRIFVTQNEANIFTKIRMIHIYPVLLYYTLY